MKDFFEKLKNMFKKVWKPIAVIFSLVFITKLGGLLSKWKSSIRRDIKEVKKEIKTETKEVDNKATDIKEQEEKLNQSLEEKDIQSEELKQENNKREESLKTFLPDLN